ncbi:hypothetical protein L1987_36355 [Smallanthus sonchifolius]|uniref:Uncharacterized protein n=1 Tax=Smallanthus sonchifolius TaxID=185202 RepID=A0ACB9HCX7_9ASTR|nr:hypothetical protein L1987_36355 [Smallanthus sonchifolius]
MAIGNKTQSVKSKYKKISQPPNQKTKEVAPQMHRRTFGTIRDPNVPEKKVPQKPKTKPSNQISLKQPKPDPVTISESAPQNEKEYGYVKKKSPAKEGDGVVKTPVRPPFSVKPVRIPGTPYLSAEKCSSCRFDRLETSSYWLGKIKSAEAVGKHFVSAAFFRLAHDCKADVFPPARNLQTELKKYLNRHDYLSAMTEWEHVSRVYGILTNEHETKSTEETVTSSGSKLGDVQEQQE